MTHTLESDWRARKRPANAIGAPKRAFVCGKRVGGGERAPWVGGWAFGTVPIHAFPGAGRRGSLAPACHRPQLAFTWRRLRDGLAERLSHWEGAGTGNAAGGLQVSRGGSRLAFLRGEFPAAFLSSKGDSAQYFSGFPRPSFVRHHGDGSWVVFSKLLKTKGTGLLMDIPLSHGLVNVNQDLCGACKICTRLDPVWGERDSQPPLQLRVARVGKGSLP